MPGWLSSIGDTKLRTQHNRQTPPLRKGDPTGFIYKLLNQPLAANSHRVLIRFQFEHSTIQSILPDEEN